MPIYEYRCAKCGDFEEMRKMSDPPLQRCPKCRRKVTKLISSTSFQLKGTGWYVTDYAKKGSDKGPDTKDSDTKSADTKGSEAKAADKSEGSDKKSESRDKKSDKKESAAKKDSSSAKPSAAA